MKTLGDIEKQYREYEPIIESKTKEELEALIEVITGDIADDLRKLNENNKKNKKDGVFRNILPFLFETSNKESDLLDEIIFVDLSYSNYFGMIYDNITIDNLKDLTKLTGFLTSCYSETINYVNSSEYKNNENKYLEVIDSFVEKEFIRLSIVNPVEKIKKI